LGAIIATELIASSAADTSARLLAIQRIRSRASAQLDAASLSHNGRFVAFVARTTDSRERSCCQHVYVLDRSGGALAVESVAPDGALLLGDNVAPSVSADGGVIAFESPVPGPRSDTQHLPGRRVVVRDRATGTLRTPQSTEGREPDGDTGTPAVSGDGLSVAFTSNATNLVAGGDANGPVPDIYLWRLETGAMWRVSVGADGVQPAGGAASHSPSVSRDGELVAFVSAARLVPEDTNDVVDVYLRNLRDSRTTLISRGFDGKSGDGASYSPALSADGRYIAFASIATTLTPADRNGDNDIYIHDRATGMTALVSATSKGEAANAGSRRPAVSADGRMVVFQSVASNLGSGSRCPDLRPDTNLLPDVYLLDRGTGCITRISGSPGGESWTPSLAPAIDGAGSVVVFSSMQPLDPDDVTPDFNLFHRPVLLPGNCPISMAAGTIACTHANAARAFIEARRLRGALTAGCRRHGRGLSCA
jgi:Tol biopolymer transport system component